MAFLGYGGNCVGLTAFKAEGTTGCSSLKFLAMGLYFGELGSGGGLNPWLQWLGVLQITKASGLPLHWTRLATSCLAKVLKLELCGCIVCFFQVVL